MLLIQQITSNPLQQQNLLLPDGSSILLQIYFRSMQLGWFINELSYQNRFAIKGMRITNSPNMLNQFRNQIPFGLACYTQNNREPSLAEDFSSGASKLYVLTADEVAEYAQFLTGSVV